MVDDDEQAVMTASVFPHHRTLSTATAIKSLQLGMGWFPEQPGGLDRYYFDLLAALNGSGAEVRGLVVGSAAVAENSDGRVRAFVQADDSLIQRWRKVRAVIEEEVHEFQPQLIVSHFALYAA